METREVFTIISLFVALSAGTLGFVTARIGYKYRTEIKRAEADYARSLGQTPHRLVSSTPMGAPVDKVVVEVISVARDEEAVVTGYRS